MRAHKALIRSQCGCLLVGLLMAILIAGLMLTIRWSREDLSCIASFLAEQEEMITVFWLERRLAMLWLWPRRFPLYALQSPPRRWPDDGSYHYVFWRAHNFGVFQPPAV